MAKRVKFVNQEEYNRLIDGYSERKQILVDREFYEIGIDNFIDIDDNNTTCMRDDVISELKKSKVFGNA